MNNDYYIKAARMTNYAFARLICKRDRLRAEHLDWEKLLDLQFFLGLMPRESLKTTFFIESRLVKTILDDGDFRELLICDTYSHSAQRVRAIKRYLQSDEAEMYAPGIRKRIKNADKWTENEISIPGIKNGELYQRKTKEGNLIACGIESPQTGIHVDRASLDDVVNEQDRRSKARRDATIEYFPYLFDMVESDKQVAIIGTPWSPVDLYAHIQELYSDIFTTYKQSIYNPDGSIWLSETYPPEKIKRLKKEPIHFSHQYLCKAIGGEDTLIQEDWIRFVDKPKRFNRIVYGIDPAYSESDVQDACDNALVIWCDGLDGIGILNSRIERESLYQFKKKSVLKYYAQYPPSMAVVENNGVQKAALQLMRANDFKPDSQEYNAYNQFAKKLVGTGSLGGRDKATRARPMIDYMELHGVWMVDNPGNRKLYDQMILFPAIDDNDGVDAASNGFLRLKKKSAPASPKVSGKRETYQEGFV